jgi:hypothetical protein
MRWRQLAAESEERFARHRHEAGAELVSTASGVVAEPVAADVDVVRQQGDIQREAADIAENGSREIRAAQRAVLDVIAETEADGFAVAEDLSVTDTRPADVAARAASAGEHADDIRWHAKRLVQADAYIGERLRAKAVELDGIGFAGAGWQA